MPRVDYQCTQCDHEFTGTLDEMPSFWDVSWRRADCPKCECVARERDELRASRMKQELREKSVPIRSDFPGFIIKGEAADAGHVPEAQRAPLPRWARKEGWTPETYERGHEQVFHAEQKFAKAIARERGRSGTPDGAVRKAGSIPWTKFLGMKEKYPDEMGDGSPPTREILEREGCLYSHEK